MAAPTPRRRNSPLLAAVLMLVGSLLLFWIPFVGPLIAGFVGGRQVTSAWTAVLIALLPAILLAALVVWGLASFDLPVIGGLVGFGVFIAVVVQEIPLILGAWFGAAID